MYGNGAPIGYGPYEIAETLKPVKAQTMAYSGSCVGVRGLTPCPPIFAPPAAPCMRQTILITTWVLSRRQPELLCFKMKFYFTSRVPCAEMANVAFFEGDV